MGWSQSVSMFVAHAKNIGRKCNKKIPMPKDCAKV
jgi:hypothetical protein